SKALRERWLLDGAPSAGPEQDETRSLEDNICRLEEELVSLETGAVCETITHTTVSSGSVKAVEVKSHNSPQQDGAANQIVQEVKVHKSPRMNKPREATEEMKRAMYSVEIKVERDKVTGETRVLSANTTLPVDLSHQGVKVYEDERKVVHEMNGENGVQLLSFSEVEALILKADEASQSIDTVTSLPTAEAQDKASPEPPPAAEITGLEAEPGGEPSVAEASAENPVTMVFMGYQSVEDEDETKKVLGVQGTVKAELVLIDDEKTSPGEAQTPTPPAPPPATKPPQTAATMAPSNGEMAGEAEEVKGAEVEMKEKQPYLNPHHDDPTTKMAD
ncbi:paralemmin-1-like, partial [Cottoperca gobio]|uniref:Paralemmin-1 n=1 Tax=Cottoperca gobio TaxID=56716 RepID=A0A6J2PFK2_COTGO